MKQFANWTGAVIDNREPMRPIPTDVQPQLQPVDGIRALIFDVYGTLVVSGSGDVGTVDESDRGTFIEAALKAAGFESTSKINLTIDDLHRQIRDSNEARISATCPKPEVDIVDIWRRALAEQNVVMTNGATKRVVSLAAEYESRANPTWPMPGASELVAQIAATSLSMGIVSNAQIFTPLLVEDLAGASLVDAGFELGLCVFSNRFAQSKPGPRVFDALREGLARRGIDPSQAIYVGNDMLNDVWAASQAGLKTAWFAGDRRSLRRREDDPRCRSLRPDIVLTDLMQLPECLQIK